MPGRSRQIPGTDALLPRLQRIREEVPAEARRFHDRRDRLLERVEKCAGQLLPWFGKGDRRALDEEIRSLEAAAPAMARLFQRVAAVRRRTLKLKARIGGGAILEEAAWIEGRCVRWEADLERIGATVPERAAVAQATRMVESVDDEVALHDDALEWISRARRALSDLEERGASLEAAPLAAELPAIVASLREEPKRGLVDDLRARVLPLEEPPPEPPAEYADADRMLADVQTWHHHLRELGQLPDEAEAELGDVRERLDVARRNWQRESTRAGEGHIAEARRLLERVRETARQMRNVAVEELRERIRHLSHVADAGEDLETQLSDLDARRVESGAAHSAWWRVLGKIRSHFLADADNAREELARRHASRRTELAEELEALETRPRAAAERARLLHLRADLKTIGRSDEPVRILDDLRKLDLLHEEAQDLARRIEATGRALEERVEALRERNRALRRASGSVGVGARRLGRKIRRMEGPEASPTHEETESLLAALETEMEQAERAFSSACDEHVRELVERAVGIVEVLETTGTELDLEVLPRAPVESAAPEDAADRVETARTLLERLDETSVQTWERLEERRETLLARLGAMALGTSSPGDREDALRLQTALRETAVPDAEAGHVQRIESLLPMLEAGDELLARFARDEQEARRLQSRVSRRFRTLKSEGLFDGCLALGDRLEALLRGIPEPPPSWREALVQLRHAQELLNRMESHGRRQVVARLLADATLLERRRHREPDGEADRLLAELAAHDPYELPPMPLRQRIHRCARAFRDSERSAS